ncbi:hypothetical protein Hanom_Chr05g00437061 [Helianthus anomalus]
MFKWFVNHGGACETEMAGDEFVSSKTKEPLSSDESDSLKSEEPHVELKCDNSDPTMDDANIPSLSYEILKQKLALPELPSW